MERKKYFFSQIQIVSHAAESEIYGSSFSCKWYLYLRIILNIMEEHSHKMLARI